MKSKTKGGRKNAKVCKKRIQSRKNMRRRRRKRVYKHKGGNMPLIMSGIAAGVIGVGIYAYSKSKKSFKYMPLEKLGLLQKGGDNCDPCSTCQITVMDKKANRKVTVAISKKGLVYDGRVIPWEDVLYDSESRIDFADIFSENQRIIIPFRHDMEDDDDVIMSLGWCNSKAAPRCSSFEEFKHFHKCIARTKIYKMRTAGLNKYIKKLENTLRTNIQRGKPQAGLKRQIKLAEKLKLDLGKFAIMATDNERDLIRAGNDPDPDPRSKLRGDPSKI
jgi:hypothetical protein